MSAARADHHDDGQHQHHDPVLAVDDDETLRAYLADTLAPGAQARVEKALRESAELRARLEDVRQNRGDAGLHTLGAIWRRGRLTCPTRQQLGSFLLTQPNGQHDKLGAYIDPPLPWPGDLQSAHELALARQFHEAHAKDWCNLFKAGHRIRLDISSSNFPRYDVNFNTGEPEGRATMKRVATNTIYLDRKRASHVVLPIVPLHALTPLQSS